MQRRLLFFFLFFIGIYGLPQVLEAQRVGVTGVLMGTVTTPSGAPVSHAQVTIVPIDQGHFGRGHYKRYRTDQDGTFHLRLPVGEYWVQIGALGFVPQWHESAGERKDATPVVISEPGVEVVWPVVLQPIASVYGTVVDEAMGAPIERGVILVESSSLHLRKRFVFADGAFVLEGLVPGRYHIQAVVDGYVTAQESVTLASGDTKGPLSLTLSTGLTVLGHVRAQNGEALVGAVVVAHPTTSDGRRQSAVTLDNGQYQITGLTAGQYILKAQKVGFADGFYGGAEKAENATVLLLNEGEQKTGIDFTLGQVGAIVGWVADSESDPIQNARIVAEPIGGGRRHQVRSDEKGHYVLSHLAEGKYYVRASADGFVPFYFNGGQTLGDALPVQVASDLHTEAVNFVLLPGGKIVGQVRASGTNDPVTDALVSAKWVGHLGVWQTQTDRAGRFEIADLPTGEFVLQVQSRQHIMAFWNAAQDIEQANRISIEPGQTVSDITVVLSPRQPGDFDGDGHRDFRDLMRLVRHVMDRGDFDSQLDLNKDGSVDFDDCRAFVQVGASKLAGAQGHLHWQQVGDDPQVLTAELALDRVPTGKGFLLEVTYDPEVAELLGVEEVDNGPYADLPLMVQRNMGMVVIAVDGSNVLPVETPSAVAQLRFRLKPEANRVPLDIASAYFFGEDGQLVPVRLPEKFSLELPPQAFRLMQNVPNPFNPSTTISFELPEAAPVDVAVYNLVGQRLRTLVQEDKAPGRYQVVWDGKDDTGRDVSSGVYFYRYHAGDFWASRRMLLIR